MRSQDLTDPVEAAKRLLADRFYAGREAGVRETLDRLEVDYAAVGRPLPAELVGWVAAVRARLEAA